MKNVSYLIAFAVFACVAGAQTGTYTWSGGSGDFTDWGATTVTEADDIRFWSTGVNTPWIDGHEGVGAATNFLCKSLDIRNPSGNASDNTLEVRNGGLLTTVGGITLLSAQGRTAVPDSETTLRVVEGSRVETGGNLDLGGYRQASVNGSVEVLGGSTVHVKGETRFAQSTHHSGGTIYDFYTRLLAVDSTWVSDGLFSMGQDYEDPAHLCVYDLRLAATNTTFILGKNLNAFHAKADFKDCTVVFTNKSSDVSGTWQAGALLMIARGADVTFDGGYVSNAYLCVGNANAYGSDGRAHCTFKNGRADLAVLSAGTSVSTGAGYITVADGADVTYPAAGDAFYLSRNGGTGVVEVVGGTLRVRPGATYESQIASRTGTGYARVTVSGGLWDHTADCMGIVRVGATGEGHIEVTGGELRAPGFAFGGSAAKSEYFQSGGTAKMCGKVAGARPSPNTMLFKGTSSCRLTGGMLSTKRIYAESGSSSVFASDGGRVTATTALDASTPFISGFASATCGAKGLTVDTDGKDVSVSQVLTDASGVEGLFRKTGNGTLTVSATSFDVANTVVDGGTLTFGAGTVSTTLTVTNGATLSTVGAATVTTLDALAVTNGTLALDPGDKIVVEGPAGFSRLRIVFSSLPTVDEMADFLVIDGELDDASKRALKQAIFDNELTDGTHGSLEATYDPGSGKTTVKVGVKTDQPLTDASVWTGSGTWGTSGNWSAGVPTATKVASFTGTPSGTDVALGSGAVAGALAFGGNAYTLTGGSLYLAGEQGAARIDAAADSTNVVNAAVSVDAAVLVKTDGPVELNGTVTGGGVDKSGRSTLRLGAANAFVKPPIVREGVLESAATGALATEADEIRQLAGVVRFTAAEDSLDAKYRIMPVTAAPKSCTTLNTIRNEEDVTLTKWSMEGGRFMKRGVGKLTVKFDGTETPTFYSSGKQWAALATLPDDGSLPYKAGDPSTLFTDLGGFSVAEGEVLLTSDVPGTKVTMTGAKVMVGICTKDGVAQPKLTVKDIDIEADSNQQLILGQMSSAPFDAALEPTLALINSTMYFNNVRVGDWAYGKFEHPTVALTNGWLNGGTEVMLSQGNGYAASKIDSERPSARWRAKDSKVTTSTTGGFTWFGGLDLDFVNSTMEMRDGTSGKLTGVGQYSYGKMNFRNGSVFNVKTLAATGLKYDCTLSFAESTWKTDDDLTLSSANVTPQYFKVESSGEGLRVAAASDKTFTFQDVPLSGDGGVRSTGAGTVAFASGMYQATGKIVAEAGVIDFTDAGTIEGAVIGAGAGVIKGATFKNATIALESVGGAVPTFENCTFTGRTKVVIAADPVSAEDVVIADYIGTVGGVGTFRLSGWKGYGGTFTAAEGKIRATLGEYGMMLMVR